MNKKQIAIEFVPRMLWGIQLVVLYIYHRNQAIEINDSIGSIFIGTCLTTIGLVFFIMTLIYVTKAMITKDLVQSGPYKYSRHPMYVSMYLLLGGLGLIYFSSTWFIILGLFIPLWYITCKLEEMQMKELHDSYEGYMERVGMFSPWL